MIPVWFIIALVAGGLVGPPVVDVAFDQNPDGILYSVERFGEWELAFIGISEPMQLMDERYQEYEYMVQQGKAYEYGKILGDAEKARLEASEDVQKRTAGAMGSTGVIDDMEALAYQKQLEAVVGLHYNRLKEVKGNVAPEHQMGIDTAIQSAGLMITALQTQQRELTGNIESAVGEEVQIQRDGDRYVVHIPDAPHIQMVNGPFYPNITRNG